MDLKHKIRIRRKQILAGSVTSLVIMQRLDITDCSRFFRTPSPLRQYRRPPASPPTSPPPCHLQHVITAVTHTTSLTDRVMILHTTRHTIDHFRDVSPSQSLGSIRKYVNLTQQKHALTDQKKCTTTQTQKNYSHVKFPFSTCDSSSLRFSKIQIGFTFLVPAHPGSPRQKAIKCVCQ